MPARQHDKFYALGTGFMIGVTEEWDFSYLVTAKHVLDEMKRGGYSTLYARFNKLDGRPRLLNFQTSG